MYHRKDIYGGDTQQIVKLVRGERHPGRGTRWFPTEKRMHQPVICSDEYLKEQSREEDILLLHRPEEGVRQGLEVRTVETLM